MQPENHPHSLPVREGILLDADGHVLHDPTPEAQAPKSQRLSLPRWTVVALFGILLTLGMVVAAVVFVSVILGIFGRWIFASRSRR